MLQTNFIKNMFKNFIKILFSLSSLTIPKTKETTFSTNQPFSQSWQEINEQFKWEFWWSALTEE